MMRRTAVVLLSSIGVGCKAITSTTHNFSYDGIISPDVAIQYGSDDSLAKGLSTSILGDIIQAMKENEAGHLVAEKECTVDKDSVACIMNGNDGSCIVQHVDGGTVVQMATHFQSHKDTVTLRAEVTLTASDTKLAREALVRLVPAIDHKLECNNSLWSIQRRPSMIDMNSVDSVIAAQEDKYRQAASVEELVLNNPLMKNRTRLASTVSDSRLLEVWSYDDVNLKEPVKALFVNGYISATSAPAGAAHAVSWLMQVTLKKSIVLTLAITNSIHFGIGSFSSSGISGTSVAKAGAGNLAKSRSYCQGDFEVQVNRARLCYWLGRSSNQFDSKILAHRR